MLRTYFLLLLFIICNDVFSQDSTSRNMDSASLLTDTGYVLYLPPHFMGLFVKTADTSLLHALEGNTDLPYFMTYNDDFKKFYIDRDFGLANFIKEDTAIHMYYENKPYSNRIIYFRAIISVRVPDNNSGQMGDRPDLYTLKNIYTDKYTHLHAYVVADYDVVDCIEVKPL